MMSAQSNDKQRKAELLEGTELERITQALDDATVRARLAEVLREELSGEAASEPFWRRLGPVLASAGSALMMLLAFFIPSIQDQWDRFESRRVVQRHVELGRNFMKEGKYRLASESFAKAVELSENKRLDIEEERLKAKVQEINADANWNAKNPEGLEEADFLYLLQLQRDKKQEKERAVTLNCYGAFLAAAQRWREAEEALREALHINPADAAIYVNLGNLLRDRNRHTEAEAEYRTALRLDEHDSRVYYDLGLILAETGRPAEAEAAFRQAVLLEPQDPDMLRAFGQQLEQNGKTEDARQTFAQLLRLEPGDGDTRRRLQRLERSAAVLSVRRRQSTADTDEK